MPNKERRQEPWFPGLSKEENERICLLRDALACFLPKEQAQRAVAALVEVFGSFSAVFLAPEEELAQAPGITMEVTRFLALTREVSRACLEDRAAGLKRIYDTASAAEAFRPKFLGRQNEAVCLMVLDGRGRLIYNNVLAEGSFTEVPVYIRRLIQLCIQYDACGVLLAHNHPSGSAFPSRNDLVVTRQVEMALQSIDVELKDHIIFAGEDYCSLLGAGQLDPIRREVRDYRRGALEYAREKERDVLEQGG